MNNVKGKENKKRGLRFRGKITLLVLVPMLISSLIISVLAIVSLVNMGQERMRDELYSFAMATMERYEALNKEPFVYQDEVLSKGDVIISGNYTVIDKLKQETSIETTVFYGDLRVATTLIDESGKRLDGTRADAAISDAVLNRGETFSTNSIFINGTEYTAVYVPLKQQDSEEIIGMVYNAVPRDKMRENINSAANGIIVTLVIVLLVSIVVTLLITSRMAKAMLHTKNEIQKVADGILQYEEDEKATKRTDEIGEMAHATKDVVNHLTTIIGDIVKTSNQLEDFAGKYVASFEVIDSNINNIDCAVNEIANGATSQANETQNANVGVVNMGDAIGRITDSAISLEKSTDVMRDCNQSVDGTIAQLVDISKKTKASVESVVEQTNATNTSVNNIRSAADMITSIANQTNLLSLNASIEAARAGEMGRGFSVVADEIRSLSEQSKTSADEIVKVIQDLTNNSNMSVETMGELTHVIDEQNQILSNTEKVFGNLKKEIEEVVDAITSINDQISQLNDEKQVVTDVVDNLAAIAEENAASAEETSASMTELQNVVSECTTDTQKIADMAKELAEASNRFTFEANN